MKTIIITGSTSGIGYGLAREFLKLGCNVVICGRNKEKLDRAKTDLEEFGASKNILGVQCDVSEYDQIEQLWTNAKNNFGQVDIWINNAGSTTIPVPLADVPSKELKTVIDTKILGSLYASQVAIQGMLDQGHGQIYYMEGMGTKGDVQPGTITLGASNNAIVYLVKGLMKEYSDTNLKFCTIRPGINVTEHLLHGTEHLSEERWTQTKRIFNILGDKPETTTPFLAKKILSNTKNGMEIAWMSPMKIMGRFLMSPFNKRDLFKDIESR